MNILKTLTLISVLGGSLVDEVKFAAVRVQSSSAPVAMVTASGGNRIRCATDCAKRPACFGFSWLQAGCRLFNWTAFSSAAWQDSALSDVFVTLSAPGKRRIASCEQSSTPNPTNDRCEHAIDGNRNRNFFGLSCTHTVSAPGQWWEGQFPSPTAVSYVSIYNRTDCCAQRLNAFSLQVDGVECNRVNLTVPFSIANFTCNAFGSRIRLVNQLSGPLTICEFEAYGS